MNTREKVSRYLVNEVRDKDNPEYMFQTTSTKLLVDAVNKKIDLMKLVKNELVNRGLDKKGNWVGHDEAAKIHKVKR